MHFQFTLLDQELNLIVESRGVVMVEVLRAVDAGGFVESVGGVA